ncbi:MAG: DUF1566 domain-containing protein [Sulfuricurvum sp.]|uniref:Lcl C-terminal domain-containing protein n=1 Tax=Sulfuricurvum sp. TaxID=2025608 RepID=UPI00262CC6C2|nr:DUF1566 domain-containing protein [Sulfuricurvum sp.]MDD2830216.1 DUF1566 domain-containing protein [Sulfuricurvum sp.]MDD4950014.1 DUF1566 domain-containing protein [Sulfuricurvum sp.]
MNFKYFLFSIIATSLFAQSTPTLYSLLGDKLYDANSKFETFAEDKTLEPKITLYTSKSESVLQQGLYMEAKETITLEEKDAYLKSLRSLEKEYVEIIRLLQVMVLKSIHNNDYNTFTHLAKSDLSDIWLSYSITDEAKIFYENNQAKERLPLLEKWIYPQLTPNKVEAAKIDDITGLYIAKDSPQPTIMWQDNNDTISIKKNYNNAINYCKELTLNGYNDWNLPDKELLFALFFGQTGLKNISNTPYWTSSENDANQGWQISFDYSGGTSRQKNMAVTHKDEQLNVRCYRKIR